MDTKTRVEIKIPPSFRPNPTVQKSASFDDLILPSSHRPAGPNASKKVKKYRWHDLKTGFCFTAGGILFYDEVGIWTIIETDKNGAVYNDIGGKYTFEDGNIWTTIRRELCEETYGLCDLLVSEVKELGEKYPPVYINGHDGSPTYACIVAPLSAAPPGRINMDSELFRERRRATLDENPETPPPFYSPVLLTRLTFDELNNVRLGFRLKRILAVCSFGGEDKK
jgi:hypothetical protein